MRKYNTDTFYEMYDHPGYMINRNGLIIDVSDENIICIPYPIYRKGIPYILIDGKEFSLIDLMAKNFIGYSTLKAIKINDNSDYSIDNITYGYSKIYQSDDSIILDSDVFKRIPNYSRYFISSLGTVIFLMNGFIRFARITSSKGYPTVTIYNDSGIQKKCKIHRLVFNTWNGGLIDKNDIIDHIDNVKYHSYLSNLQKCDVLYNTQKAIDDNLKQSPFTRDEHDKILKLYISGNSPLSIAKILFPDKDPKLMNKKIQYLIYSSKSGLGHADIKEKYKLGDIEHRPVITEENIRDICYMLNDGFSASKISAKTGFSMTTIYRIKNHQRWNNISSKYLYH